MVVPGVSVIYKDRVISPDGLILPDFLKSWYHDLILVRDIFFYIPPIWGDRVLEIIFESVQFTDSVQHWSGVLRPENKAIYFVGR